MSRGFVTVLKKLKITTSTPAALRWFLLQAFLHPEETNRATIRNCDNVLKFSWVVHSRVFSTNSTLFFGCVSANKIWTKCKLNGFLLLKQTQLQRTHLICSIDKKQETWFVQLWVENVFNLSHLDELNVMAVPTSINLKMGYYSILPLSAL